LIYLRRLGCRATHLQILRAELAVNDLHVTDWVHSLVDVEDLLVLL